MCGDRACLTSYCINDYIDYSALNANLCKSTPGSGTPTANVVSTARRTMHGSIQRRITVATNWAVTRIACLDDRELYEDSYALTEEFREWILCADDQPELILDQVLMVPNFKTRSDNETSNESDGLLEI